MSERFHRRLKGYWATARCAHGAAVFSIHALALTLNLYVGDWLRRRGAADGSDAAERAELDAQRRLHRAAQRYLRFLARVGIVRVSAFGVEGLARSGPHLVVSNHPSLIDIVVLCSFMPQADCIVNPARARNPVLRGLIRAAGFVRSDTGPAIVRECAVRLRRGRSLIVFPEGTRSPAGGLGRFRRGAARVALSVGCDLVPVLITCDPPAMWKDWKWSQLPERPIHVTVRVLEPIPSTPIGQSGLSSTVAARKLTAELRELFSKGLESGDADTA
jgi:1-acyl-sn-glycerol-3-phosphate acyltransferase